ncbi:DUF3108 domain-containing protein [Oecophyllibacter saccharovorans]|nr:DUF3108 domain-containing protein [Oecophyllibacter saccharovorans]
MWSNPGGNSLSTMPCRSPTLMSDISDIMLVRPPSGGRPVGRGTNLQQEPFISRTGSGLRRRRMKKTVIGTMLCTFLAAAPAWAAGGPVQGSHPKEISAPVGTALPAEGQQAPAKKASSAFNLQYAIFVHGFHVLNGNVAYAFQPWGYAAQAHIYTVGLASWFLTLDRTARAKGYFAGTRMQPTQYESQGLSRGKHWNVQLAFSEQAMPKVIVLTPKDKDEEREPLPERDLQKSVDLLTAFGILLHKLNTEHSCNVTGVVFDGLRLTRITSSGPVPTQLPDDHHTYFTGPALRCGFVGQQIAGFPLHTKHRARLAAPHPGNAWFQELPGVGLVPVRIELDYPKLGHVLMVVQVPPGKVKLTQEPAQAGN